VKRRQSGDQRLHRLADDVYLYRGFFSNSGVLVFPSCVVVVDSQVSPLGGWRLRDAIREVTDKPVRYVVHTHFHGDHTGGNAAFPEAEIIGNAMTARFVVERDGERLEYARTFGLEFENVHPTVAPTRTFEGSLRLTIDGDALDVLQIGAAETSDACVVWWPSHEVLASGDGIATWFYPFLGTPFVDEGLHDDGEWLRFLAAARAMRPRVLLPGHGPPIVGAAAIAARVELLSSLLSDLLEEVRRELLAGTPLAELVNGVDARLARYPARRDLVEHTVSQRFAIYRAVNSLRKERAGRGWWQDLRPSIVRRASGPSVEAELARVSSAEAVCARAAALVDAGERPLAIALLQAWTAERPRDAAAHGQLADVLFDGAEGVRPAVDATELLAASGRAAKTALLIDPDDTLSLLNLGALEVFGGAILAQPMARALAKLRRALDAPGLTPRQRRKATFFTGKAHQLEGRSGEADHWYRMLLPPPARVFFPLVRGRLWAFP
jgi:glyoxylase-like metal-dependent hydrolase (beta-lactamase superfamily II)